MRYSTLSLRILTLVVILIYILIAILYIQVPYLQHLLLRSTINVRRLFADDVILSRLKHGSFRDVQKADVAFELHIGSHVDQVYKAKNINIAVGCALTSKKLNMNFSNPDFYSILKSFPLFESLLPSFCKTSESQFVYHFYFAYDINDRFFIKEASIKKFANIFLLATNVFECVRRNVRTHIHFLQCSHANKPAWAQNDAMMEAYHDGMDYFYRINDDTIFTTPGWTSAFIYSLKALSPPNVGVVGPKHEGGNAEILTYDFVHKTHIDIFGYYYPRTFTDWYADTWITKVYSPYRSIKLEHITLKHTLKLGQRYQNDWSKFYLLPAQIAFDKQVLQRYIGSITDTKFNAHKSPSKIISFSIDVTKSINIYNSVRNAQLLSVLMPSWEIDFHVPEIASYAPYPSMLVPKRICKKLEQLGAKLVKMPVNHFIPPKFWSFSALFSQSDENTILHVVLPVENHIIGDREYVVINDWLSNTNKTSLCILNSSENINAMTIDKEPEKVITWALALNSSSLSKIRNELLAYFSINEGFSSNIKSVNKILFENVKNSLVFRNLKI